ncbi:MAG: hypothetical protein WC730_02750 [Patescibacteria group bacterium]
MEAKVANNDKTTLYIPEEWVGFSTFVPDVDRLKLVTRSQVRFGIVIDPGSGPEGYILKLEVLRVADEDSDFDRFYEFDLCLGRHQLPFGPEHPVDLSSFCKHDMFDITQLGKVLFERFVEQALENNWEGVKLDITVRVKGDFTGAKSLVFTLTLGRGGYVGQATIPWEEAMEYFTT